MKIAVLASGRGSTFQSIIDAIKDGKLDVEVSLLISNVKGAMALERAKNAGIRAQLIASKGIPRAEYEKQVISALDNSGADLIVCVGYMRILSPEFIRHFKGRLINTHPALLPSFGGKGMYGEHVHKAVIDHGCKVSGCTVHFMDENVDGGPIILQHSVPVKEDDTPGTLAARIIGHEHRLVVEAIRLISHGALKIEGRRVRIPGE